MASFSVNGLLNPDVFSLKPSASQGEFTLKIGAPFKVKVSEELTNVKPNKLPDILLLDVAKCSEIEMS